MLFIWRQVRRQTDITLLTYNHFLWVICRSTVRQKMLRLACCTPCHCFSRAVVVFREIDIDGVYLETRLGGKQTLHCLPVNISCALLVGQLYAK